MSDDLIAALRAEAPFKAWDAWRKRGETADAAELDFYDHQREIVRAFADELEAASDGTPRAWIDGPTRAVIEAAGRLRDAIWRTGDLRDANEADLVDVWNRCTVMSARLSDFEDAAADLEALDDGVPVVRIDGHLVKMEFAGCFDIPGRVTVAYEDEPRPDHAAPLWRLPKEATE